MHELENNRVVVVPTFEWQTTDGEITTLGRGGSDTTATASGSLSDAEYVDIFTDVEGIMTADPEIVEDAAQLEQVTYVEMCNSLAFQGAKVIHPRAKEIAMQNSTPFGIRSTMSDHPGTLVTHRSEIDRLVREVRENTMIGVTQMPMLIEVGKIRLRQGQYHTQLKVFKATADHGISAPFYQRQPQRNNLYGL